MNLFIQKSLGFGAKACVALILFFAVAGSRGQVAWPPGPPITPNDQRNSLKIVGAEVQWLQNATRTAANYGANGYGVVRSQFEKVRAAYGGFKMALTPRQWEFGANDLAELDAGLDIIQEVFLIFENDVANGRSNTSALRSMCQVLNQAAPLWLKELNRVSSRLRVGFP